METTAPVIPNPAVSSAQESNSSAPPTLPGPSSAVQTPASHIRKFRCRDKKYFRFVARHGETEAIIRAQQRSDMRKLEAATVHAFCSQREMKRARRARQKIVGAVQTFPSLELPPEQQEQMVPISRDEEDDSAAIIEECSQLATFGPRFPGKIVIQDRLEAIKQALAEHDEQSTLRKEHGRHSYHVDAAISTGDDHVGIGIAHKSRWRRHWASEWTAKGYCIRGEMNSEDAEAWAVWQALTLIQDDTCGTSPVEKPGDPCSLAIIYSDCLSVLQSLRTRKKGRSVAEINIISRAHELMQLGVFVELHWVPGHRQVPGNYLADQVAERALWCSLPRGKAFCYDD